MGLKKSFKNISVSKYFLVIFLSPPIIPKVLKKTVVVIIFSLPDEDEETNPGFEKQLWYFKERYYEQKKKKNKTKKTPFLKKNTQKLLGNKYDFAQSTNFGTQKIFLSFSPIPPYKKKLFREKNQNYPPTIPGDFISFVVVIAVLIF